MTHFFTAILSMMPIILFWTKSEKNLNRKHQAEIEHLNRTISQIVNERTELLKKLGAKGIDLEVANANVKAAHKRSELLGGKIFWIKAFLTDSSYTATEKLTKIMDKINE